MKLAIHFAEVHTPVFIGGTNLGLKLDPSKRTGLKLTYDRVEKELIVEWNACVSILPISNVGNMVLSDPTQIGIEGAKPVKPLVTHKNHPMKKGIQSAQVQTPTGHVFQGEGAGVTKS